MGSEHANGGTAAGSKSGGDLLDLEDIFGGGAPAPAAAPAAIKQNGSAAAPAAAAKSDVDLLADIFSVSAAPVPAAPMGRGVDLFAAPSHPAPAPAAINPMDLFGAPPQAPSFPTQSANFFADPFGAMPQQTPAPAAVPVVSTSGTTTEEGPITVPGFSHAGLTVEFECTKPDIWNKQKSALVAKFKNTTGSDIYGLSLQCAVPKYVTMEMQPPTSTTVPVTGGHHKIVTQSITVTNSMMGTKNLMLKLKLGFTSKGTKIEHMATCSSFPAGKF
jgi:AP-1 complex subunit gamma-1